MLFGGPDSKSTVTMAETIAGQGRQNVTVTLSQKFQGEAVVPGEHFFGFYKTRDILLSNGANCTVLRAVVLKQYRRVTDRRTDRRTDEIAVANTALAMRALRAM